MPQQRIVVVDDNLETLDVVRDILEAAGYAVDVAPAVDAGLHEIRDGHPDLIIVDLLLSNDQRWLSGWDVVRLARSHGELYRLPIIVISADPTRLRALGAEAAQLRNVRLMAKPFGVDELADAVREMLPGEVAERDAGLAPVSPGRALESSPPPGPPLR